MNRKVLIAGLAATALIPAAAFADSISVNLGLGAPAPVPVQYEPGYGQYEPGYGQPAPTYYEQAPVYGPEYYGHPHRLHWDAYRHCWVRYDWRVHQWYPVGPETGWR